MIKAENGFELTVDARSENEGFARQCVSSFLLRLDPTVGELADMRTVVSEAVTNCVIHAYKNSGEGKIYISVRLYAGRKMVMKIKDTGCGMEDPDLCRTPLYTTDPSGERGGMGFAIMENFTDRMKVKSAPGKGTTLTLTKIFT